MTPNAIAPPAIEGCRPIRPPRAPAPRMPATPSTPAPCRPSVPIAAAPREASPGWRRLPFPLGDFRFCVSIDGFLHAAIGRAVVFWLRCIFEGWRDLHGLALISHLMICP